MPGCRLLLRLTIQYLLLDRGAGGQILTQSCLHSQSVSQGGQRGTNGTETRGSGGGTIWFKGCFVPPVTEEKKIAWSLPPVMTWADVSAIRTRGHSQWSRAHWWVPADGHGKGSWQEGVTTSALFPPAPSAVKRERTGSFCLTQVGLTLARTTNRTHTDSGAPVKTWKLQQPAQRWRDSGYSWVPAVIPEAGSGADVAFFIRQTLCLLEAGHKGEECF